MVTIQALRTLFKLPKKYNAVPSGAQARSSPVPNRKPQLAKSLLHGLVDAEPAARSLLRVESQETNNVGGLGEK